MATQKTHTLLGGGAVYIGLADGSGAMRFLGEASKAELSFTEDKKTLKNYSTRGGGYADVVTLIGDVKLSITAHGFDVENLAMATFGESGSISGGTVTGESHTAYKGGYIRVAAGISLTAVVVKKGATTLVSGTDYEVKGGGIQILATTAIISDGDTVTIDYTHADSRTVEAILNTGKEYRLILDGFNQAYDDAIVVVDIWKAKATPASVGMIGDEIGGMELTFDILKDSTKTGDAISKFFKITQTEG